MKKSLLLLAAFSFFALPSFSQTKGTDLLENLSVTPGDIYILSGNENGPDKNGTGYHLYIRKKPGVESVMLIESNKDPEGKQTNYAYRATSYNKINGDEIRILNGKKLESDSSKYSLIDSTAEPNEKFGQSFHIYIPETMVFGYPWTRNGTARLAEGVFINIRTFTKKYADYSGAFKDNSFNFSKPTASKIEKTKKTVEKSKNDTVVLDKVSITKEDSSFGSLGNYAEQLQSYNSAYITQEEELEKVSSVPFEEQDEDSVDIEEKVIIPVEKDIPALNPFEEEELPEEETEIEIEPEEEIPEDERDPVSEIPYDELNANYSPEKLERSGRSFDGWVEKALDSDPEKPFAESMDGVDPNFIAKLEEAEAIRKELEEKAKLAEKEGPVKVELGNRFVTHNIEMLKIEGSKKIPSMYVSKTEISQLSYRMVTGMNPSANQGDYYPVESVSWYDVIVFCNLLSIRDGLVPCYSINEARNPGAWGEVPKDGKKSWPEVKCDFAANGYRMLTVEEWTYAATGGPQKQNGKYAGNNNIDDVAWYRDNSDETTHIVGMKYQNACGLYDMCGNVSEWCWGETGNAERSAAVRGGNYTYEKKFCAQDFKDACQPWYAHFENGIRICRIVEE